MPIAGVHKYAGKDVLSLCVHSKVKVSVRCFSLALCILVLVGCAAPKVTPQKSEPQHWSFSQTVQSDHSMITLFDPADLAHHEGEPEDWYR